MKITIAMLIAAMCLLLGFGCAVNSSDRAPQPTTDETEQDVNDCSGWEGCYSFCRKIFHCTTPSGCDSLTRCLTNCDASFPTCTG